MPPAIGRSLLLLGLLLSGSAPGDSLVIVNARIWQGGDGYRPGAIEIEEGRIVAVGEAAAMGSGVRLDVGGRVVIPGLIDAHVHLLAGGDDPPDSEGALDAWIDSGLEVRLVSFLEAGVTTVSSSGDFWPDIRGLADRVEAGQLRGPRILYAGPFFSVLGGHPDATMCTHRRRVSAWCRDKLLVDAADGVEVEAALEQLADAVAVKLVYDDLGATRIRRMGRRTAADLVQRAAGRGLPIQAHVYEPDDALALIELGVRRFVHVPGSADREADDRLFAAMRGSRVMAASTLSMLDVALDRTGALTTRRRFIGARRLVPMLAREGLLALGTDAPWLLPAAAVRRELGLLVDSGLTPLQALEAATHRAAAYLGRDAELGRIAPGFVADLLVLQSDPLASGRGLRDPLIVIKAGRVVVDRR